MNTSTSIPTESLWFYTDPSNEPIGPVPFSELLRLAHIGTVLPNTFVIENGKSDWVQFQSIASTLPPALPIVPPSPSNEVAAMKKPQKWPPVVSMLLCNPLGLVVLWLSKAYSTNQKKIITIVSGVFFTVACLSPWHGAVFLALFINATLFTYWGEKLTTIWKIPIYGALCLFVLPMVFAHPDSTGRFSDSSSSSSTSAPAAPANNQPAMVRMGQAFNLGDFTYTILSSEAEDYLGASFDRAEPSAGALFLVVHYQITNDSHQTRTVASDDFVLRDAQGNEFRPSSSALTALLSMEEDKDFILSELQPSLTKETVTAFEVPQSSLSGRLILVVPEKGWGGGKQEILVQ